MSNGADPKTPRIPSNCWFEEAIAPGLKVKTELKEMMFRQHSGFQLVEVIETTTFGRTLVLDGLTQSAELDEFCYHESLVHPAMLRSAMLSGDDSGPKSVFIGGGGEMATAREVLRHKSVERLVMVDLDGMVVDVSKKYLPEWGGEAVASDPRLQLVIGDAYQWLMETEETFDVIIMDICDPVEAGPGIVLYTKEFYEHALTRLNKPHGVLVTQSGSAHSIPIIVGSSEDDPACFGPIVNTLKSVFDCAVPFSTHLPSFGGDWGFTMAFNAPEGESAEEAENKSKDPGKGEVDALIESRIEGGEESLGFYDSTSHLRMFHLAKPLRKSLSNEKRIMTKADPIYMFS